ncbi:MAG: hypothetical protein J6X58_07415 [Bacteroidales bacterium]|nr:hypothetical protein [Bacteroidales bacterium]
MSVDRAAVSEQKAVEGERKPRIADSRLRITSISIAGDDNDSSIYSNSVVSLQDREVVQLTQERLEELWAQLVESCKDDEKLYELLADKKVVLKNNNLFNIQVPNLYLDTLLLNYQNRILGFLRQATCNESLQYKAVVVVEKVEARAYLPRDKFDEMAKRNPSMLTLRKLFPDIDF